MSKEDYLIEFDKLPKKPQLYKITLFLILFILGTYLLWVFPILKNEIASKGGIATSRLYPYSLLFIYPIIGLYGYTRARKYGWFILTHYMLTSIFLVSIVIFNNINHSGYRDLFYLRMAALYLSVTCCLVGSIFLFRKEIRHLFGLKRKHIWLLVLLYIVFIIVHIMMITYK